MRLPRMSFNFQTFSNYNRQQQRSVIKSSLCKCLQTPAVEAYSGSKYFLYIYISRASFETGFDKHFHLQHRALGGINLVGEFCFSCRRILPSPIPNEHPVGGVTLVSCTRHYTQCLLEPRSTNGSCEFNGGA